MPNASHINALSKPFALCIVVVLHAPLTHAPLTHALTPKACFREAIDTMEQAYCEILAKGGGTQLPDLYSFRQNSPQTQLLVLQRPAQKAGIKLPEVLLDDSAEPNEKIREKDKPNTQSDHQNHLKPKAPKAQQSTTPLKACQLYRELLRCRDQDYYLVVNLPSTRLSESALTQANQLRFTKRYAGDNDIQYLSSLYPQYIDKMLMIGLGDSTLSFTKFHALFESTGEDDQTFAGRFHQMYELLKTERRSMGIKQRYQNNFPETIKSCMRVSSTLIACDNINQNWIYQRAITGE